MLLFVHGRGPSKRTFFFFFPPTGLPFMTVIIWFSFQLFLDYRSLSSSLLLLLLLSGWRREQNTFVSRTIVQSQFFFYFFVGWTSSSEINLKEFKSRQLLKICGRSQSRGKISKEKRDASVAQFIIVMQFPIRKRQRNFNSFFRE